jgi:hypothetical protein
MVPKNIRLFLHLDAPDHAVLGEQDVTDLTQQFFSLRTRSALSLELDSERLDAVEDTGNAGFRMPENQAL